MRTQHDQVVLAPTDLSNFLSCRHLSSLDLDAAHGERARPARYGPLIDELKARGMAHEREYLEHLRARGLSIAPAVEHDAAGIERTRLALREGYDVVYQPMLEAGTWSGRADFLLKVDSPSELGSWSYEVVDTKLARDTKAGTILQLCVYSYLLEQLQGRRPDRMHVVTPGNEFAPLSYRLDDYGAYYRLLEHGIGAFIAAPAATYPELVPHCDFCVWWSECERRRRADDHLCYVAGISALQMKSLRTAGIDTLGTLAVAAELPVPRQGSKDALERVREQARVQHEGRRRNAPYYELKAPLGAEHGLALLPEPCDEDLFLDFEGNHFAEHGVQEYLTGYVVLEAGTPRYTALWARTFEQERAAFERFVDTATAARARNPNAHIYHFAPYEPAALKRLMGRFATRETDLDRLLRGGAFVDLHSVVRRSLLAGVERYSIKDLEPLFGYERAQSLREASMSRRLVEHAIEAGDWDAVLDAHARIVEDYNREDCESTWKLRDWLESLRAQAIADGHELPRPVPEDDAPSDEIGALDRELQRLRDGLLEGVPADPEQRDIEQQARFVLAHMMEFHRREDKAGWWEYFRVLELDAEAHADERRAVIGLRFERVIDAKRAPVQRYRFEPQDLDARGKDDVYDTAGQRVGQVEAVSYAERTLDIKKKVATADVHPPTLLLHNQVPAKALQESLMRLGERVLGQGFAPDEPYRAAFDLLQKRAPPLAAADGALKRADETTVAAASRLALGLDGNVLAIQGPPGTGKTYTGAHMICALQRAGLKVGVTAVSHKVIVNLLEGAAKQARKEGLALRIAHKRDGEYEGEHALRYETSYDKLRTGLADGSLDVVGATAWGWARQDFEQSVDVLIVDEAGQMSLANVLATAPAGRSLVLLGDPQQLEQPLQSSHPEGSEVSALYHLLDGRATMPPERGLFLDETWRLHPDIARFTSEVYYEGRVKSRPELVHQAVVAPSGKPDRFAGSGLRFVAVEHRGNQAKSAEEIETIAAIVAELMTLTWRDKDGELHPIGAPELLIVAPYNAQVAGLVEALPELKDRIGTVDRFQGQEAPVVVYSMTSSSPEDAPRGMEFLYNRHRFNVATSRARALCILVGSPALFSPECRSPRQMRMANGFCRYLELARSV